MEADRADFLSRVAERANVPEEDAADLAGEFLRELARKLDRRTWEKVEEIVPLKVDAREVGKHQDLSIEEFLLELSGGETVEDQRAGGHARAVAGAIREMATESQVHELIDLIEDDAVLALFEERRGELTTVPEPSDGDIAQHTRPQDGRDESVPG